MTATMTITEAMMVEAAAARQIALNHDLDPDDARLGYPSWQIPWIIKDAKSVIAALSRAKAESEVKS